MAWERVVDQGMLENIIAEAIGQEGAQKAVQALMDELGGAEVYIPTGDREKRSSRNLEIRRLYRAGVTFSSLAARFEISESQVRRIIGE